MLSNLKRALGAAVLLSVTMVSLTGCSSLFPDLPEPHKAVLEVTGSEKTVYSLTYNSWTNSDSDTSANAGKANTKLPWKKNYAYTGIPAGNAGSNTFSVVVSAKPNEDGTPSIYYCTISIDGTVKESKELTVVPGRSNQMTCEYSDAE